MNSNTKIALIVVAMSVSICIGMAAKNAIDSGSYETAKLYNTAIQASSSDQFNYAVDSRQGNVLTSGYFTAKDAVSLPDVLGDYFRIEKVEERYTQHTEYYECGTEENPQTCTRTYYSWDYHGSETTTAPWLTFHGRDYRSDLFSVSSTKILNCDAVLVNCRHGHSYEDDGWWTSEGDLRWYYRVTDQTFWGTIITNTMNGRLEPVKQDRIVISPRSIEELVKDVNNPVEGTAFLCGWIFFTLMIGGIVIKEIINNRRYEI